MKVEVLLVLLTVVVAVTTESTITTSRFADHLLLFSLLQVAGFSDIRVAAALNSSASASQKNEFKSLLEEIRDTMREVTLSINKWETRPRHCKDIQDSGDKSDGPRVIYPYPEQTDRRMIVYCSQKTHGGGWTVFQRRINSPVREDFYRTWREYQLGFGNLEGEFWLGLDSLHVLTSTALQELFVGLGDYEGVWAHAKYSFFHIGGPESLYQLSIGKYTGDAGDCLGTYNHPGSQFSTHDADHDRAESNCAKKYRGGWWYSACHVCNLNGYQYIGNHTTLGDGINWGPFRGLNYSLWYTALKIRPAF